MRAKTRTWAAALAAIAATAGCGLTGSEPNEPAQQSGTISIGDRSQPTKSVKCTQTDWTLSITAQGDPGTARAMLQLGGQRPEVRTVAIENIDGLSGVSGGIVGKAEASLEGSSVYTISGTARVTDSAHPSQTSDMPFTIEAPC